MASFDPCAVVAGLSEATQHLLLAAAAAAPEDVPLFLGSLPHDALTEWGPAEDSGLVRLDGAGPQPLLWLDPGTPRALYDAARFVDRQRAHLSLADALAARPDRRAWHLAAATLGPDEEVAAALEDGADAARVHTGWAAAARMLERSAELTADPGVAARRYLLAMRAAIYAGDSTWVGRLGARAGDLTDDPAHALEAALASGWALARTDRHAEAITMLTTVAVRAADGGNSDLAWSALAPAAVAAYYSGRPEHFEQMVVALEVMDRQLNGSRPQPGADEADSPVLAPAMAAPSAFAPDHGLTLLDEEFGPPHATWLIAALDPVGSVKQVEAVLAARGHPAGLDQVTLNQLGGAAWTVDQTRYAVTALRTFLDRQEHTSLGGVNALVSNTLGTALRDCGAWDAAGAAYGDALRIGAETGAEMIRRTAEADLAMLAAMRGDPDQARSLAAQALAGLDPDVSRAVAVATRRALGLTALADGDHERAHDVLRLILDDSGRPVHPHLSLYGMVDLVTACVRTGRYAEGQEAAATFRQVAGHGSVRLRALVEHAAALVAAAGDAPGDQAQADIHFALALSDPEGPVWPYEHARIQLDFGAWLRRQRRVIEARPHLVDAQSAFERLGAAPFALRASAELRAAGVRPDTPPPTHRSREEAPALASLTPQQREIVLLAAQGLTNREIAERLFLSPRTVGMHLYRVFPQLGVTSRTQLRDIVDPPARRDL
ncbi:LuxR family transcriptional regulator [Promicromonospora sp. AC04]|uniref:LuxR family transcriptional regulator n=1 Tax=Promicromonospora sp. AC04 TaxID=2135723 RepID=UPI0011B1E405|nr:LuxR family transcriptional regulator [Promicromonospora sp. AC04]